MNRKEIFNEVVQKWEEFSNIILSVREYFKSHSQSDKIENILNDIEWKRIKHLRQYLADWFGLSIFERIMTELEDRVKKSKGITTESWHNIYLDYGFICRIIDEETEKWNKQTKFNITRPPVYHHYDNESPDQIIITSECNNWPWHQEATRFPNWRKCMDENDSQEETIKKIHKELSTSKLGTYCLKKNYSKEYLINIITKMLEINNTNLITDTISNL